MVQICKCELEKELIELLDPEFFKTLGDPSRISILLRLLGCCGSLTVSEVSKCCPVDISVISRHLIKLKDSGFLISKKKGREVIYEMNRENVAGKLRRIAEIIEKIEYKVEESDEK